MSRWRIAVVVALILVPLLAWAGIGSYALWRAGLALYVWWPLMACVSLGYLLAWHWQRKNMLLRPPSPDPPMHWTDRDRNAWSLVEARCRAAANLSPEQLTDPTHYFNVMKQMATEMARFYHPSAQDPVGRLTIPECLAVIELAAHDLADRVDRYLPGGHLMTIDDWKRARQAVDYYQTANKAYWFLAALYDPVQTALRYTASQVGLGSPLAALQQHLQAWFYVQYLNRVGTYLIELHSGRLRVGATQYRALLEKHGVRSDLLPPGVGYPAEPSKQEPAATKVEPEEVQRVTITLVGQVKAGKSSLVNALLGEQRAVTDVLPATDGISRYALQPAGVPARLTVLDTVGYGHTGPKEDQLRATQTAAQESDVLLLVLHARNPGRQADVELLASLRKWFAGRPELRRPPVLAVLTHVDLLSPAMEWAPPYDWQKPRRPKEQQIREALATAREQLGDLVVGVIPVCAVPGKVYGVEEWLLPAISDVVDEGRAVALLRALRAEADAGKLRKVLNQSVAAGRELLRALLENPGAAAPRP